MLNVTPDDVYARQRIAVRPSGCWEWTGAKFRNGYGQASPGGRGARRQMAHRFVYELLCDEIPAGLVLDHLCRNTICVNPAHLEPVTQRVNVLRGTSRAAEQARRTHCHRGHEFTDENTYHPPGDPTQRICRVCMRANAKRKYAEQKAALGIPDAPKRKPCVVAHCDGISHGHGLCNKHRQRKEARLFRAGQLDWDELLDRLALA